jgi:hypothetical protein
MWSVTDAWLLQAIAYAGRRGDLSKVIGKADYINVAIPTRDELERSVNRLAAADLVEAAGARVRATRRGRRLVRRSGRWNRGLREIPRRLAAVLEGEVPFPPEPAGWSLSDEDWRAACDRYYPPEKRAADGLSR